MVSKDYIIVGNGIAGTILSYTLLKNNKDIIVVANPEKKPASKVAAGIFNPIVFKRLVKSWRADELINFNLKFYPELETFLGKSTFHTSPIYKVLKSESDSKIWQQRIDEKSCAPFLGDQSEAPEKIVGYQTAKVNYSGYIDLTKLLDAHSDYLKKKQLIIKDNFDFSKMVFQDGKIQYQNILADKVIFCEGYHVIHNPYFKWLPMKLTKGETITIESKDLKLNNLYSKDIFLLPKGNNQYLVGATYEWEKLNEQATEKGKRTLAEKLERLIKSSYKIIKQDAGIRPTVRDRRPLLGIHPEHKQLAVFNGLGTKGVFVAPYFANALYHHLENQTPLDSEVDINRFGSKGDIDINLQIIKTKDGSHTIRDHSLNETYHSIHGSVREAQHVFIKSGLEYINKKELNIFEVGFGTGLNACLTFIESQKRQLNIRYDTIEKYPLNNSILDKLNFSNTISKKLFNKIHKLVWNIDHQIHPNFQLKKIRDDLIQYKFNQPYNYDLIFFDAFAPNKQAEMWTENIFQKIFDSMPNNGTLVTYCAKGSVKRTLKSVGFIVEAIPGPPGKREMIRATKLLET